MADRFEDLKRLAMLLDEGKLTQEEFDQLKSELLGKPAEPANPMEGRPIGWYEDPTGGKTGYQAFWDGRNWTGDTRPKSTPRTPSKARSAGTALGRAMPGLGSALPAPKENQKSGSSKVGWLIAAIVIVVILANLGSGGNGSGSGGGINLPPATVCKKSITYQIGGSTTRASLTMETASGGTEQLDPVRVPWSRSMGSFDCGSFIYLSAQNDNDTGSISCQIKADGVIIEQANSSGAYVIASCSGSVPR